MLDALRTGASPTDAGVQLGDLAGRSQAEIADAITDALRPVDGTQDTDAARDAMARAFSELLEADPTADLTTLSEPQVEQLMEAYIANDLAHRIELDVGKAVLDKAPDAATGVARLDEMKAYVRQEVARAFRARQGNGQTLDRASAASLSSEIIRDTFEVFESHL